MRTGRTGSTLRRTAGTSCAAAAMAGVVGIIGATPASAALSWALRVVSLPVQPSSVSVADFDRDGDVDLAALSGVNVRVALRSADGSYDTTRTAFVGNNISDLVATDVDNDGDGDLVAANQDHSELVILRNNGAATFTRSTSPLGVFPLEMVAADVDRDGDTDVVVTAFGDTPDDGRLVVMKNLGDGRFVAATIISYLGGAGGEVGVADLDLDGRNDLVVATFRDGGLHLFRGHGDLTFDADRRTQVPGFQPQGLALGDMDEDGRLDVVVSGYDGRVVVFSVRTGPVLGVLSTTNLAGHPTDIGAADFGGEGHIDLAVTVWGSTSMTVLEGRGDATFTSTSLIAGGQPLGVVVADVDSDGRTDFAASILDKKAINLYLNRSAVPAATVSVSDAAGAEVPFSPRLVPDPLDFVVRRVGPSTRPATVAFHSVNGSATSPSDYVDRRDTLFFPANVTTLRVSVIVVNDAVAEPDETMTAQLLVPTGMTLGDALGAGVIHDNDLPAPLPSLSIADASVIEGDSGDVHLGFRVTLSAASSSDVTVGVRTANQTAIAGPSADYAGRNYTLTIPAGTVAKTFIVNVHGDDVVEADETLTASLSAPAGANIARATAVGTIVNDD